MSSFKAYRYDGQSSARRNVNLIFLSDSLTIRGDDNLSLSYPYSEISLAPKLAGKFHQMRFSDGSQCDVAVQPGLDEAFRHIPTHRKEHFFYQLETKPLYIFIALLLSLLVIFAVIQYGVPEISRLVAYRLPVHLESGMGKESTELFEGMTTSSELSLARQQELEAKFRQLANASQVTIHRIVFRKGNSIGPNAFALPAGNIIFTDEIVTLAEHDNELLAVFAHELGHVKHRHTMRHVLQNSLAALLIIMLTGDVGAASSLAAALPTVLLQTKFSRDFETEADDFAIALLTQQNIPATNLGNLLHRIEEKAGGNDIPGFLSTHPSTDERMKKFSGQ